MSSEQVCRTMNGEREEVCAGVVVQRRSDDRCWIRIMQVKR